MTAPTSAPKTVKKRAPKSAPSSKPASKPASKKPKSAAQLALVEPGAYQYPAQPEPFPFQARCADKVCKHLAQGANTCVVSPTGSGKTVIAGTVLHRMIRHLASHRAKPLRAISVSHSNPLRDQLEERLCPSFTVQGLLSGNIPQYEPDLVIWDECHHSEGDLWATARRLFPKAVWLGLTPTPQRSDGRALGLFDEMEVAAHYSELIAMGVIVPCKVSGPQAVHTDKTPDPVQAYLDGGENQKALFFMPDIDAANDVAKQLVRRKIPAAAYHSHLGKTVRKDMFRAFAQSDLQAIVTCFALSEGIDVPDARVAVLAQHCAGVSQFLNTVGRVLRRAPGKQFAHLIDLKGAALRHGPPTMDREYSLYGAGIYRKDEPLDGGSREYAGREELPSYKAKLVTWYDWKWPTVDDRRRQLSWLRSQAAQNGYTEEDAAQAFRVLFGEREKAEAAQ